MQWTDRIRQVKILLVLVAVVIAVASLVISHFLVRDLAQEEKNKMEVWSEAMRTLNHADENTDLNLVLKVIDENNTIPVVVMDDDGNVQVFRNVELKGDTYADSMAYAAQEGKRMKDAGRCIRISDDDIDVCYDESVMIKRLNVYPYVQLGVVMLFVVVAIFALLTSKKAEQNKVWVGLSKETAHQLGTPISSLMAWTEILKESYPDDPLLPEMDKDVQRLQLIAERFSKIGSLPEPVPSSLCEVMEHVIDYMDRRTSHKVKFAALRVGHREPLQERRRCDGRLGHHHPVHERRGGKGGHRGERYGQRHSEERHQERVHPGIHYKEARLGSRPVACQAHRRGVSQGKDLRRELGIRQRHHLPHRTKQIIVFRQ